MTMTPTVGEINEQIREGLALTGPGSAAIAAAEHEVMQRHRRVAGWVAAAELHREQLRDGQGSVCGSCSNLAQLVANKDDIWVEWPCSTASALGLDR